VRQIIFDILACELHSLQVLLEKEQQADKAGKKGPHCYGLFLNQFNQDYVEQVAMDLVDFFKIFVEWHCGLN
jgi:hypothetical protein